MKANCSGSAPADQGLSSIVMLADGELQEVMLISSSPQESLMSNYKTKFKDFGSNVMLVHAYHVSMLN